MHKYDKRVQTSALITLPVCPRVTLVIIPIPTTPAAYKVANHPKPKSQLPTVIKTLNIRMPKFKSFDSKVHDSAMEIVEFAKKKDMENILKKHKVIMNNCVACHTQFRSEISKALSE